MSFRPGANCRRPRRKSRPRSRQNDAAERALTGVRNEAMAGQRTTQDVLNAEQALVNARQSLIVRAARSRRRLIQSAIGRRPAVGAANSACRSRSTIRKCTIIRCATAGSACARRAADRSRAVCLTPSTTDHPRSDILLGTGCDTFRQDGIADHCDLHHLSNSSACPASHWHHRPSRAPQIARRIRCHRYAWRSIACWP